jgi:hypothetical protein
MGNEGIILRGTMRPLERSQLARNSPTTKSRGDANGPAVSARATVGAAASRGPGRRGSRGGALDAWLTMRAAQKTPAGTLALHAEAAVIQGNDACGDAGLCGVWVSPGIIRNPRWGWLYLLDGADAARRAIGPASQSALMRREAPAIKPDSRDAPAGHP